jgi:uncharacterized membrane protein
MLLHDSLDDAVSDVSADLPALAVASRNQGLSIRRRRRALSAVGSVAAATVVAIGAYTLVPDLDGDTDRGVATDLAAPVISGPLTGKTAPVTDRAVAAGLAAAVGERANGTFGRFQGGAYDHEAFAALLFEPATGSGPAGQVMINVQPLAMAGKAPYGCEDYLEEYITGCTSRPLPNGDVLRTYREDDDTEFGLGSQRQTAEVISPERRLRIIVNAMNTNPWADGGLRDRPVLTAEQAAAIARQPWWSWRTLPVEYAEAGKHLEGFTDANADES